MHAKVLETVAAPKDLAVVDLPFRCSGNIAVLKVSKGGHPAPCSYHTRTPSVSKATK